MDGGLSCWLQWTAGTTNTYGSNGVPGEKAHTLRHPLWQMDSYARMWHARDGGPWFTTCFLKNATLSLQHPLVTPALLPLPALASWQH